MEAIMKNTKFLSFVLAIALVISLIPVSVFATDYDLWIGGVQVTDSNLSGSGWSYDPSTNTLSLNNYNYSAATAAVDGIKAGIYCKSDIIIELTGTNSIEEASTSGANSYGIYNATASVSFQGAGTLSVSGTTVAAINGSNCGVFARDIVLENGFTGTINANGGSSSASSATASIGLCAANSLNAYNGILNAEGGDVSNGASSGIFIAASGTMIISGGAVTARGGNASTGTYDHKSVGIYLYATGASDVPNLTITGDGTSVMAEGRSAYASYGINFEEENGSSPFIIGVGSTVTAYSAAASNLSYGIRCGNDIDANGNLTAYTNGTSEASAIYGYNTCKLNNYSGKGYTNAAGTSGEANIPTSVSMSALSAYKRIVTTSAPSPNVYTYDELVAALAGASTSSASPTAIKLMADINATSSLFIGSNRYVVLDLNGYIIDRGLNAPINSGYVIEVDGGNLTINDSEPGRIHSPAVTYTNPIDNTTLETINGGIITGCNDNGDWPGAICVKGGTLTLNGGSIALNTTAGNGGGVYVRYGSFNMNGGGIIANTAGGAGAVNIYANGTFNMSGGIIRHNTSGDTGAIYAYSNQSGQPADAYISGGQIIENVSASGRSGAVTINTNGQTQHYYVSGNPVIIGNKVNGIECNLNNYTLIALSGPFTSGAKMGVTTTSDPTKENDQRFTSGYNTYHSGTDPADFFTSDKGYEIGNYYDGEACLKNTYIVSDYVDLVAKLSGASTDSTNPTHIRLTSDIDTSPSALTVGDNTYVELDLNGHIIDRNLNVAQDYGHVMDVHGDLTIRDSNPDATHSPAVTYTNPIDNTTVETISGGIIKGAYISTSDSTRHGALNIRNGKLTLEGGTIALNKGNKDGVGVNLYGGTFNMSGGGIVANMNTSVNAGAIKGFNGTFNMSGGTIRHNISGSCGAIYLTAPDNDHKVRAYITGGEIKDNVSAGGYPNGNHSSTTGAITLESSSGYARYYISGNPIIKGNIVGGIECNLTNSPREYIDIDGPLTNGASIGISTATDPTVGEPKTFTSGYNLYNSGLDPETVFTSDKGYVVTKIGDEAHLAIGYDLWVGGVHVNAENKNNITAAITSAGRSASGSAVFDDNTNTLTLTDFTYNGEGYGEHFASEALFTGSARMDAKGAIFSKLNELNLSLTGTNSVTVSGGDFVSAGIFATGTITVNGTGSLASNGGDSSAQGTHGNEPLYVPYLSGIFAKDLIVSGGSISSRSGNDYNTYAPPTSGLYIYDKFTVNDGSVYAIGGETRDWAYGGQCSVTTINGGNVTIQGGIGYNSYGLFGGSLNINGGELTLLVSDATNAQRALGNQTRTIGPGVTVMASKNKDGSGAVPYGTDGVNSNTAKYLKAIYAAYDVSVTAGDHMTLSSGTAIQTGVTGAMTDVEYTADEGYYFPTDYYVASVSGITVTRNDHAKITVSGTPTSNAAIVLAAATAQTAENTPAAIFTANGTDSGVLTNVTSGMKYSLDGGTNWTAVNATSASIGSGVTTTSGIRLYKTGDGATSTDSGIQNIAVTKAVKPTAPAAVDCTSSSNNDGKLTGVSTAMEYKKSDAQSWTDGSGSDITGLIPGTYYVRVKASGAALASDDLSLDIREYTDPSAVATPVLPAGGSFTGSKSITITCETSGASIYYTTDGSVPTSTSIAYKGAFDITGSATISAIAVKAGMPDSAVATAVYTLTSGGDPSGGGSSGGSSSGGGSSSNTKTTTNADGSVTTTTTYSDNSKTEVTRAQDGASVTVKTDKDGKIASVSASVPSGKTETALPAALPKNTEIKLNVPAGSRVTVTVPVAGAGSGTVFYAVAADGTKTLIKDTAIKDGKLVVELSGSATLVAEDNAKTFSDVPSSSWAKEAVDFVTSREIFNGTGSTTFGLGETMTRGMLMTVLARFDGADASGADWMEKGMDWSIAKGISDGSDPNRAVTRQEIVTMLWRYAGSPVAGAQASSQLESRPDGSKVEDWAQAAMAWALENKVINGDGNGNLNPGAVATREQVAQLFMNFVCRDK